MLVEPLRRRTTVKCLVKGHFAILAAARMMSNEFDRLIGERVRLVELPRCVCHGLWWVSGSARILRTQQCALSQCQFLHGGALCGLVVFFSRRVASFWGCVLGFFE